VAEPPETFRSHVPAMAGSTAGALLSAVIGSHLFGALGTGAGLIIGSAISGTISWWAERGIRRSQEIAKAKLTAARRKGRVLSATETQQIEVAAIKNFEKKHGGFHFHTIGGLFLVAIGIGVLTVVLLDRIGARDVATFTPAPRPTVTQTVVTTTSPTIFVSTVPVVTPDPTPSVTPSAIPDPTPSLTPSASTTPVPEPSSDLAPTPAQFGTTDNPQNTDNPGD
jgi:hypothetical protein